MSKDQENYRLALKLQKEGKYNEAVAIANQITDSAFRAGILIDSGSSIGKSIVVREGISLFQDILKSNQTRISKDSLLYNIGNGFSEVYRIRRARNPKIIAPNDDDLRMAKKAYRESLAEPKGTVNPLRSQILVNYGNCLSMFGRNIEAIQAYQEALLAEPQNGMAAGNLGIELNSIANITGRYTHEYLLLAHKYLQEACGPNMHLTYGGMEAARAFRDALQDLQARIDAHKTRIPPLEMTVLPANKKAANLYIRFCMKHQLFLNAWVGDPKLAPAISDEIAFSSISMRLRDSHIVVELLRVLNEIKETYSTARYLFYLSQSKSVVLNDISAITSFFDANTEDLHGLYTGLCKSAYVRSFDVLDKVARIINIYFKIGKRDDHFWNMFVERQSRGKSHELRYIARPTVTSIRNYSLYALSDLCIDYFESEHVDFKTIDFRRNRMTHDYIAIPRKSISTVTSDQNEISFEELYRQTLSVLQLSKLAILYAVNAVCIAEVQKALPSRNHAMTISQSPGDSAIKLKHS